MDSLCSLIIIEDEDQIRDGLSVGVPWEEYGFRLAGSFSSGEDALEYLKEHDTDAVLSDICLGGISGLEISGWLHANRPAAKVVLISGYSDFQYAQEAIRCRVSGYLLKPIDIRELRNLFTQLRSEIRKAFRESKELRSSDEFYLKAILSLSLAGGRNDMPVPVNAELIRHSANGSCFLCRISHPAREFSDKPDFHWDSFSPAPERFCSAVIYRNPHAYLIAVPFAERALSENAHDLECSLGYEVEKLSQSCGCSLSVTLFKNFASLDELCAFLSESANETASSLSSVMPAVIRNITSLNSDRIRSDFSVLDEESLRAASYILLSKILQFEEQYSADSNTVSDYDFQRLSLESGGSLRRHAEQLLDRFDSVLSANSSGIVDKACLYIQECKGRKVSLSEVADYVFVSPSYLSKLFKKQKNMNFKSYVSSVSLEYAKNLLLNTQMKVVDISELLGFRDVRYFYKFFRDGSGTTPAEFRKQRRDL